MRIVAWAGGAAFAGSLLYLGYFYVTTLANAGGLRENNSRHIAINTALFMVFALHHTLFARTAAKQRLTRVVPERLERTLYVWVSSALLVVLCVWWQPVAGLVYRVDGWARLPFWAMQAVGAAIALQAARAMSALELAGIHQAEGRASSGAIKIVGPFRYVRHPMYLGWMLIVFGSPTMTANRLLFAILTSAYLVLAIPLEERSLVAGHSDSYPMYQSRVRWRVFPGVW